MYQTVLTVASASRPTYICNSMMALFSWNRCSLNKMTPSHYPETMAGRGLRWSVGRGTEFTTLKQKFKPATSRSNPTVWLPPPPPIPPTHPPPTPTHSVGGLSLFLFIKNVKIQFQRFGSKSGLVFSTNTCIPVY